MSKAKLLENLREDTYCRIVASKVHGVGVGAIKDIPKGVDPFMRVGKEPKAIPLTDGEVQSLSTGVKKMVEDFTEKTGRYWYIPETGLNALDVTFYLNHNDRPNIGTCRNSNNPDSFVSFITKRCIKKGEELFINYNASEVNCRR